MKLFGIFGIVTVLSLMAMMVPALVLADDEQLVHYALPSTMPRVIDWNQDCDDINSVCNNSFKPSLEPPPSGTYDFVTIASARTYFNFASERHICAVIVKGGNNANVYSYNPPVLGDADLHAPLNSGGQKVEISHIEFFYEKSTPSVPEVAIIVLLGIGLAVLGGFMWLRRHRAATTA